MCYLNVWCFKVTLKKRKKKMLSQMSRNLLERWIMVGGKSQLVWIQISFPKVSKQEIDLGLMFVKWQNYLFMFMCLLEVKLYSGVLWLFKNSQRKKPLMFKSRWLELGWETFLMLFLQRFKSICFKGTVDTRVNVIFGLLSTFINPEFSNLMCSTSAVVWMTGAA